MIKASLGTKKLMNLTMEQKRILTYVIRHQREVRHPLEEVPSPNIPKGDQHQEEIFRKKL